MGDLKKEKLSKSGSSQKSYNTENKVISNNRTVCTKV